MRLIEPLQHLLAGVRRVLRAAGGGQPAGDTDAGDFCLLSSGGCCISEGGATREEQPAAAFSIPFCCAYRVHVHAPSPIIMPPPPLLPLQSFWMVPAAMSTAARQRRCGRALPRCGAAWRSPPWKISSWTLPQVGGRVRVRVGWGRTLRNMLEDFQLQGRLLGSVLRWTLVGVCGRRLAGRDLRQEVGVWLKRTRRHVSLFSPSSPTPHCPLYADFSLATPSGQQGHATADVLLGCMEVALEDLVDALTGKQRLSRQMVGGCSGVCVQQGGWKVGWTEQGAWRRRRKACRML